MKFDTGNKTMGIYAIYIDNKIVYIGQSKQLQFRAETHERNIRNGSKSYGNWYPIANKFYLHGHNIELKVLEEVEQSLLEVIEEKYIKTFLPIFNIKGKGCQERIPQSYEDAARILGISTQPYIGSKGVSYRDRAERMGWFGENYPNTEEFYWWEHK